MRSPNEPSRRASRPLRSLLLYPLLVGVPVLGVAGVLRAGASIRPPASVGGRWSVRDAAALSSGKVPAAASTCASRLDAIATSGLAISQSGPHLAITLGDSRPLAGLLSGDSIAAASSAPIEGEGGCRGGGALRLKAELARNVRPELLHAAISVEGCAACGESHFTAERQAEKEAR